MKDFKETLRKEKRSIPPLLPEEAEEALKPTDVFSMAERKSNPEEVISWTHRRLPDQSEWQLTLK